MPHTWDPASLPPEIALQRLVDGNQRFRTARRLGSAQPWDAKSALDVQHPFAIILGCSDSRTPVEIVFDQGFGDVFVVRVAGNIAAASVVGSIEFAASQFGSRLVVVMGHTLCGAVGATVRALETGLGPESKNIRFITDQIAPHVAHLVRGRNPLQDTREAVRVNVRATVEKLRHGSPLLEQLVQRERIAVLGAEYELETGTVNFLDDVAAPFQPRTKRNQGKLARGQKEATSRSSVRRRQRASVR